MWIPHCGCLYIMTTDFIRFVLIDLLTSIGIIHKRRRPLFRFFTPPSPILPFPHVGIFFTSISFRLPTSFMDDPMKQNYYRHIYSHGTIQSSNKTDKGNFGVFISPKKKKKNIFKTPAFIILIRGYLT